MELVLHFQRLFHTPVTVDFVWPTILIVVGKNNINFGPPFFVDYFDCEIYNATQVIVSKLY